MIKFGYKFNKVFLASLKSFFIKILVLKNVQKNKNTLIHNFYGKAASYLSKKLFSRLHKPKININDSFLWRYSIPGLSVLNADTFKLAINVIANKYLSSKKYPSLSNLPVNITEVIIV